MLSKKISIYYLTTCSFCCIFLYFGVTYATGSKRFITFPDHGGYLLYNSSYALVIGIDKYQHDWLELESAVKDAEKVASELEKRGFDVTFKSDLTSKELKEILGDFFIAKGNDPRSRLFVWFAGHGYSQKEEGYIIPSDTPLPDNEVDFKRKAISMRRFHELVRQANSNHILAVFDSCFAGTIFSQLRAKVSHLPITKLIAKPVRHFITSGCADQEVFDDGTFRKLFIQALSKTGDLNHDGYLTATELGDHLYKKMKQVSDGKKLPMSAKLKGPDYNAGDFVFFLNSSSSQPFQDKLIDGKLGPQMVEIQPKRFRMGDLQNEKPVYFRQIKKIAVSVFEITFGEYDLFCEKTGRRLPSDENWGERKRRPVINVTWDDAYNYTQWLSNETGNKYRLPTEEEWEFIARGGTTSKYWWGNTLNEKSKNRAACDLCGGPFGWDVDRRTAPVGTYPSNKFGVFDTVGNVWEWTCSLYSNRYTTENFSCVNPPQNGKRIVIRGGAWDEPPVLNRVSARRGEYPDRKKNTIGFRVVKDLAQ